MALTLGAYAWPAHARPVAAAAVVVFTAVNYLGVAKTARVTRILVVLTLAALAAVVTGALTGPTASPAQLVDWFPNGPLGLLQAAGLLFFAFAGYARIATLGEEVKDPARTIPRAIPLALGIVVVVYAVVAVAALAAVGPAALASSPTPLATAAGTGDGVLAVVVRVGGAVAAGGVLLSLLAGVGRTTLAMARDHELPHRLAAIHPRYRVPHRAGIVIGVVALALVLVFDLRDAIGFSSFAVLVYYAIANSAALTLPKHRTSTALAIGGLVGCFILAAALPLISILPGILVLLIGLLGRALLTRLRPRP
jgi:APA family basic amino acid/polyamine antiporter